MAGGPRTSARSRYWPDRVKALEPEAIHSPLGADFPRDELGALARAFDRYLARLGAFIERERAFTADVSHELRTPLSIIQGAAEIQEEDASLTPRQRARALRVQRAAQDMAEITTALLVLAREQRVGSAPPTSVAKLVQDAVERHRYLLGAPRPPRSSWQLTPIPNRRRTGPCC